MISMPSVSYSENRFKFGPYEVPFPPGGTDPSPPIPGALRRFDYVFPVPSDYYVKFRHEINAEMTNIDRISEVHQYDWGGKVRHGYSRLHYTEPGQTGMANEEMWQSWGQTTWIVCHYGLPIVYTKWISTPDEVVHMYEQRHVDPANAPEARFWLYISKDKGRLEDVREWPR